MMRNQRSRGLSPVAMIVIFFPCFVSAADNQFMIPFPESQSHRVESLANNTYRVARDSWREGRGGIVNVTWCGDSLIEYTHGFQDIRLKRLPEHGVYLANLQQKKTWKVQSLTEGWNYAQCLRDGRWLIFSRSEPVGNSYRWTYLRFDLMNGKSEVFASVLNKTKPAAWVMSPDKKKIYFPVTATVNAISTREPTWKIVQSPIQISSYGYSEIVWIGENDLLILYQTESSINTKLLRFSERGLTSIKEIPNTLNLRMIMATQSNYFYGTETILGSHIAGTTQSIRKRLHKCRIVSEAIKCSIALRSDPDISPLYQVSSDNSAIYYLGHHNHQAPISAAQVIGNSKRYSCVYRHDVLTGDNSCVWDNELRQKMELSPDGGYLAIISELKNKQDKNLSPGLYVLKVKK